MKPFVRALLLFLCLCFLITSASSCHRDRNVDDLTFRLLNLFPSLPPTAQYIKNAEAYTAGYLSPEEFSYLYIGSKERLPEWNLIEEFRIVLSVSTVPFELHVLKTASTGDTDEVAKLLERRAELIRLHNKTEGDYRSHEPMVYTSGRYAILAATEDNEAVRRLLRKLL